jgi:hypothetical protein
LSLDPNAVPASLRPLLPWAEKWGIGDDYDREALVETSSVEELMALVHSIDDVNDDDLFGWLAGADSYSNTPTEEYSALTCLTMAIDSAKMRLMNSGFDVK